MKLITLRRMKDSKVDGKPILDLPEKTEQIFMLELTKGEREYYDVVHSKAKAYFNNLMKTKSVLSNYVHLLEAILRMRQVATHRKLIKDESWIEKLGMDDAKEPLTPVQAQSLLELLKNSGYDFCAMCQQDSQEKSTAITPCGHPLCTECLGKHKAKEDIICPTCQHSFDRGDVTQVPDQYETDGLVDELDSDDEMIAPTDPSSSIKVSTLINDLLRVRQQDPQVKSVIFSQWYFKLMLRTSMLRLVEATLKNAGFGMVRLDGSMSRQARYSSVNERFESMARFKSNDKVTIFLVSLKSGGVGLNLTRASRVYLLEPYWNPAVEQQAIDRVHRLGQTREVVAIRFIVKNTVEENMLQLQKHKLSIAESAFREGEARKRNLKEEKDHERMLSLKMLFQ
jgi:SWI/SNF-related matrix-associated actin-dependent regulator of chromatin subfamily A3